MRKMEKGGIMKGFRFSGSIAFLMVALFMAGCMGGNKNGSGIFGGGNNANTLNFTVKLTGEKAHIVPREIGSSNNGNTGNIGGNGSYNLPPVSHAAIANYSYEPNANLRILFFNVSEGKTFGQEQGRLDLISKGDFDVAVVNVPESKEEKTAYYLTKYADDIEYFIVPSTYNIGSVEYILKNVPVATLVLPQYNDASIEELANYAKARNITVMYVKAGSEIDGNGISLKFTSPFPGLGEGPDVNSVAFYLLDRTFTMFFANDINDAVANRMVTSNLYQKVDIMTVPKYGVGSLKAGTVSAMTVLMSKLQPSEAIFEGSPINFQTVRVEADPHSYYVKYFDSVGTKEYSVGNAGILSIYYTGTNYTISTAGSSSSASSE